MLLFSNIDSFVLLLVFFLLKVSVIKCLTHTNVPFENIKPLSPPKNISEELLKLFTFNYTIPIEYMYIDDTLKGHSTHYQYSTKHMDSMIKNSVKTIQRFKNIEKMEISNTEIKTMREDRNVKNKEDSIIDIVENMKLTEYLSKKPHWNRLVKKDWVYYSIFKHQDQLVNKSILIYGSSEPWVEVFCIAIGVKSITVVEYNDLTYNHSKIVQIVNKHAIKEFVYNISVCNGHIVTNTSDYALRCLSTTNNNIDVTDMLEYGVRHLYTYDAVFSISSFDHDGLGRYGDPIHPASDIRMMDFVWSRVLNDTTRTIAHTWNPMLFLTLPIGKDLLVYNLHRRYGATRLPFMINNFVEKAELIIELANARISTVEREAAVALDGVVEGSISTRLLRVSCLVRHGIPAYNRHVNVTDVNVNQQDSTVIFRSHLKSDICAIWSYVSGALNTSDHHSNVSCLDMKFISDSPKNQEGVDTSVTLKDINGVTYYEWIVPYSLLFKNIKNGDRTVDAIGIDSLRDVRVDFPYRIGWDASSNLIGVEHTSVNATSDVSEYDDEQYHRVLNYRQSFEPVYVLYA